ncbi:hypothetical protein [Delftia acidovorans]|uniref:ATP-binding protein n=1 Tax=Delftia acidovorans TaxID=80866 RepID=UPI003015CD3F
MTWPTPAWASAILSKKNDVSTQIGQLQLSNATEHGFGLRSINRIAQLHDGDLILQPSIEGRAWFLFRLSCFAQ